MKKIIALLCLVAISTNMLATVKVNDNLNMGMKLQTRITMDNVDPNGGDSKNQFFERTADIRMRPWFGYKLNDYVSAKVCFEIGDIRFGDAAKGGAIGGDGVNVETKHIYIDVEPNSHHKYRIGLQGWKDSFGIQFDTDVAGFVYYGKFKNTTLNLGYMIPLDQGEVLFDETTVSRGTDMYVATFDYKSNKNIKFGMDNIAVYKREAKAPHLDETALYFSLAPKFEGQFKNFYIGFKFAYEKTSYSWDKESGAVVPSDKEDVSGYAFSLKSKLDFNDRTGMRADFLFTSADDEGNYYHGIAPRYSNQTEILSTGNLDGQGHINPIKTYAKYGVIMPSLEFYYEAERNIELAIVLAMAKTVEDVRTINGKYENAIGTEIGFKGNMKFYEKLNVKPYLGLLLPGEAFTGKDTDIQMKFGIASSISL